MTSRARRHRRAQDHRTRQSQLLGQAQQLAVVVAALIGKAGGTVELTLEDLTEADPKRLRIDEDRGANTYTYTLEEPAP